jgi:hypothetical protein
MLLTQDLTDRLALAVPYTQLPIARAATPAVTGVIRSLHFCSFLFAY